MHEITILSGKGGTGKTSITGALASLAQSAVICDNDVDAADLFLVLSPEVKHQEKFISGWTAEIDSDTCIQCGICQSHCRFDAISKDNKGLLKIDPLACEGCRLCERICPQKAITSFQNAGNSWYESQTKAGPFFHAQMGPGEENSGRLVTFIRRQAKLKAREIDAQYIISDGPPGIGCPVIASLSGTQQVLLIIEPTQSGWHDAERLIRLIGTFKIPTSAIINKAGIHPQMENKIEAELETLQIPLLAKVPFSHRFRNAMLKHQTLVEYAPHSEEAEILTAIWERIETNKEELQTN
ncbi:MAG: 4Fe-4S binding protein [Carboxylicivirga sp.]|jgi:MinD superfamily P-loop ATPase|nr:4Fe-4S binding protein [Carboxylicivirga sp.]